MNTTSQNVTMTNLPPPPPRTEGSQDSSGSGTTPGSILLAIAQAIATNTDVQATLNKLQNTLQAVKMTLAQDAATKQMTAEIIGGSAALAQGAYGLKGAWDSAGKLNDARILRQNNNLPNVAPGAPGGEPIAELQEIARDAEVAVELQEIGPAEEAAAEAPAAEEAAAPVNGNVQGQGARRTNLTEPQLERAHKELMKESQDAFAKANSVGAAIKGGGDITAAIAKQHAANISAVEQKTDGTSRKTESTISGVASFISSVANLAASVTQRQIAKARK